MLTLRLPVVCSPLTILLSGCIFSVLTLARRNSITGEGRKTMRSLVEIDDDQPVENDNHHQWPGKEVDLRDDEVQRMRMIGTDAFEVTSVAGAAIRLVRMIVLRLKKPNAGGKIKKWNEPDQKREDAYARLGRVPSIMDTMIDAPVAFDGDGNDRQDTCHRHNIIDRNPDLAEDFAERPERFQLSIARFREG